MGQGRTRLQLVVTSCHATPLQDAEPTPAAERLAARVQLALARIYEAIDPVPIK